jgi:H+/Cl- antiporter ClcA
MTYEAVDSRTAARVAARLFLVAVALGALTGLATWLFIVASHYGTELLWHELPAMLPGVPPWLVSVGVVAAMTVLATLIVVLAGQRPADMGRAETEYDHDGRMEYRHLPAAVGFSLTSLWSGAVIGPEAPLVDINGGVGTWVAERLRLDREQVRTMAYAGVAGAFAAFFGAAPVGALLAAELISPKAVTIDRTRIVAGLTSGATGWVVYATLGGESISPIFSFPPTEVRPVDLGLAVLLGIGGCVVGLVYGGILMKTRVALRPLRARPWAAAVAGGVVIAAASVLSPYLLFSGQEQVPTLLAEASSLGVLTLVGLGVAKLALNIWTLSTAYFGGPIFPAIFAGACFGLAVNLLVPAIPQDVAVVGMVSGLVTAAAVAPLSVTVFLALIVSPSLTSVIAIAAVAAFIVRQLVAPTLPGIYRATRAMEAEAATAAERTGTAPAPTDGAARPG